MIQHLLFTAQTWLAPIMLGCLALAAGVAFFRGRTAPCLLLFIAASCYLLGYFINALAFEIYGTRTRLGDGSTYVAFEPTLRYAYLVVQTFGSAAGIAGALLSLRSGTANAGAMTYNDRRSIETIR